MKIETRVMKLLNSTVIRLQQMGLARTWQGFGDYYDILFDDLIIRITQTRETKLSTHSMTEHAELKFEVYSENTNEILWSVDDVAVVINSHIIRGYIAALGPALKNNYDAGWTGFTGEEEMMIESGEWKV